MEPHNICIMFNFSDGGAYITYQMLLYLPWLKRLNSCRWKFWIGLYSCLQQQGNVQRTTTSSKVVVNEGNFVGGSFPSALQTCSVETLFYNESNWVHWSLAPNCTLLLWRVQFNPAPTKLQMHVSSIEKRMKSWLTPFISDSISKRCF